MKKIINFLENTTFYISVFFLVSLLSMVLFQIFARQLFNVSYIIIDELIFFFQSWCVSFTVAYALFKYGHASVTFFYNKLNVSHRRFLYILVFLSILIVLIFLTVSSWNLAMRQMPILSPFSGLPRGYRIIPLSISSFIMCLFVLNEIYEVLWRKKDVNQKLI